MKLALAGALVLALSFPAHAVDFKDPNCPTLAEVEQTLTDHGEKFIVLDSLDLLGVTVKQGGKVIVATFGGYVAFGIVSDGCVSQPAPIGEIISDKSS